jgi:hypothetical protein
MDSTVSLIAANGGEYGHFPLTYPFDVQQKRCAETFMFHFFWQWTRARGEGHRARVRLDNWVFGCHFADCYIFLANTLPSMFASHA